MAIVEDLIYVKEEDSFVYKGLESLLNRKLGVIIDYSYSGGLAEYIKAHTNTPRIQPVGGLDPLEQNLQKLKAGRIDTLCEGSLVMENHLKNITKVDIKLKAVGSLSKSKSYIAFTPQNPKSPELAKILSDGMIQLRKSGELKKILDKYGLKDWK